MPRKNSKSQVPAGTAPVGPFGRSILRREGPGKLTGKATYIDDLPLPPGGVHVRTVRSRISHGRIKAIRYGEGVDWSKVSIIDHRDLPGPNVVRLILDDMPALVKDVVKHREEAILLLASDDKELLERAVRAVEIDYEEWPAAHTIAEAKALKARVVGEDNIFKKFHIAKGDAHAAMVTAHTRVKGSYSTPAQEHTYIEPNGMLAEWDGRTLTVQGSMQCPYYVHTSLTYLFGLPADRVRIIQTETGGGFGGKEDYPSMIAAHAALVAFKTGRPAKLIYDREEDLVATTKRHPSETTVEAGFDADGRLVALTLDVAFNGGAYCTLSPVVLSRGVIHAGGAYDCPHIDIVGKAYATNIVPFGAFRGFGAPQTLFAIEAHMDRCAQVLGVDPVELRRKNLVREGSITSTGQDLGTDVAARETMEHALRIATWEERRAAHAKFNKANATKKRGLGLSVVLHGSGFTGNGEKKLRSRAKVDTLPDGRVRALAANTEMGQGTKTVFAQILAQALGLEMDDIVVAQPDTSIVPDSGPTVASRTVMVVGNLLKQAAELMRGDLETKTGKTLDTRAKLLAAIREAHAAGTVPAAETRYEPPPSIIWNDDTYQGSAYGSFAWMSSVAEVEIDLVTCETKLTDLWLVSEVGTLVNPIFARGQVEGGAAQAAGWALLEDVVWKDGTMWNAQLTNYILPTSADAARMHVEFIEKPCQFGPFGAKGLGELPMDGPAGAIVAAIRDAVGVLPAHIPATPERLAALLEANGVVATDLLFGAPGATVEAR